MLATPVIVAVSLAYLALLFAVAYYARRRSDAGRSIVAHPSVYALSLGVYATSWTFYGSVGRAAGTGVGFLPVYLGPTLMFALGWLVLRKIIRISKENRITSIADFIASRYGKSTLVGGLVTIIAVLGIVPYISLQLKAVSDTVNILTEYPRITSPTDITPSRCSRTRRSTSRWCSPPSPSCSARASSTRASATRAWSPPSPSSRSSSWSPSSPSGSS